jgi:hypothetical protein
MGSRDSVVGMVTKLRGDDLSFEFRQEEELFLLSETSSLVVRLTLPPIQWVWGQFPRG